MITSRFALALTLFLFVPIPSAKAAMPDAIADGLAPHRAVYDIDLTATHSGSQILNVSGQMTYEWKSSCEGWTTDHHFKLFYEYADSPGMRIMSDFSTFETHDGKNLNFTSRRHRDGEMYQQILGQASTSSKSGKAVYSSPESLTYDLAGGTLFPVAHTVELVRHAQKGDKFFNAQVFDGSDEDGPIEMNAFIGKIQTPPKYLMGSDKIDQDLLKTKAWAMRLAVFPTQGQEEESDYEMAMLFHENGVISDMNVDYDGFSVHQRLVSLEKIAPEICQN